ncbi:MAG TPA: hypothetical protein VGA36_01250 [Nitriliruptorales bacterium]
MTGPWVVALVALGIVVLLLVVAAGRRSPRDGGSTAGHYDPNAIGSYTLDPATMTYRFDLPTEPRTGAEATPRAGPPRRRRRRRPTDAEGG